MTTSADAVYAQAADLPGGDPDETTGLARDWRTAQRSHQPNTWQRIRRPLFPRCHSIADGLRCQHRTIDGTHPGQHGHHSEQDEAVYEWPNPQPGNHRPWSPDRRNPKTGATRIRMKRACNGCGTRLGDATSVELAYAMHGLPLPDVTGECPTCRTVSAGAA